MNASAASPSTLPEWPNGKTRVIGVIGSPVTQVRAPAVFTDYLRCGGANVVVLPFAVAPADLPVFLAGMAKLGNLAGLIATIPHKPAALSAAATASDRARRIGAANALRKNPDGTWHADMFDGVGFLTGLLEGGFDPQGKRAAIIGAGGVGAAIAAALVEAGALEVTISDVDPARALALAGRLERATATREPALGDADLVVNATPLGMRADDPFPTDPAHIRPGAAVAEVIMAPPRTAFLDAAAARGHPTFEGRLVMEKQIPHLARFFLGDGAWQ